MEILKQENSSKCSTRRCISSGETCYKSDMIRFVVDPNNEILPDIAEKLPGRGIWIKTNKNALALIVGVSNYENTKARALYADNDAMVFKDYATEKLGISENRIKILLNDGAD